MLLFFGLFRALYSGLELFRALARNQQVNCATKRPKISETQNAPVDCKRWRLRLREICSTVCSCENNTFAPLNRTHPNGSCGWSRLERARISRQKVLPDRIAEIYDFTCELDPAQSM